MGSLRNNVHKTFSLSFKITSINWFIRKYLTLPIHIFELLHFQKPITQLKSGVQNGSSKLFLTIDFKLFKNNIYQVLKCDESD